MGEAVPAVLAEEQWGALGQRLSGIEASLQVCQHLHASPTLQSYDPRSLAYLRTPFGTAATECQVNGATDVSESNDTRKIAYLPVIA